MSHFGLRKGEVNRDIHKEISNKRRASESESLSSYLGSYP